MYSSWEGRHREEQSFTSSLAPKEEGTPSQSPLIQAVSCPDRVSGCSGGQAGTVGGFLLAHVACIWVVTVTCPTISVLAQVAQGQEVPAPPAPVILRALPDKALGFSEKQGQSGEILRERPLPPSTDPSSAGSQPKGTP